MFKTDQQSLEKLSFHFNEQDISRFRFLIEKMREEGASAVSADEMKRILYGLDEMGKIKLDGKLYAFAVEDNSIPGCFSDGVKVFRRYGDTLRPFIDQHPDGRAYDLSEAAQLLIKEGINKVYTGEIQDSFLGLPLVTRERGYVTHCALNNADIKEFREYGIEAIVLDSLV